MSMLTRRRATAPDGITANQVAELIGEIEQYLAQPGRATAHPLVTRSTADLIAEALSKLPNTTPGPAPTLTGPSRWLRHLPDWALPALRPVVGRRDITVAEHLALTALLVERYGWEQGRHRSRSGRRCILGAQAVLYRLGYGDEHTVDQAARHIQTVLGDHGIRQPYHEWNDAACTSQAQVVAVIREAATAARKGR